ncbi:MAG: hypothetical protein WC285_02020 [Candidatus Gracilibacteria bacterium]|jgi:hypothetical protein
MARFAEARSEENQPEQIQTSKSDKANLAKLTEKERDRINKGEVSIHELAAERRNLKNQAESELNRLVTMDRSNDNVITMKEYKDLRRQLDETESPEETRKILERIKDLGKQKELEKGNHAEESKKLDPEDQKLLELQDQFNDICDENEHLIGTKQIAGFKEWFSQERRKNPTVSHLKEQIRKLEGKEVTDRNGLSPRREEYQTLQKLFKRYGLGEPTDSKWIEQEGLSERKRFRQNAESMEKHLDHQRDTGFYSKEAINQIMEETLSADNPQEQEQLLGKARKTARKESESYVYLDNRMDVQGKSVRKMSEKSKKKLTDYYKNETDFDEREKTDFKQLVENEGELATQLEEIYGDDVKGLHLALDKFQTLDFVEKQGALKQHTALVKEKTDKDELHKKLILDSASTAIDKAAEDSTISEKTAERYHELFEDEENYKNPETKKPGDLKTLQKMYDILISPAPQANYKNLAAYKARRDKFMEDLGILRELMPENEEDSEDKINEWQESYNSEGWSKRTLIHEKLKKEVLKQKLEKQKHKKQENEAGIDKKDKKEASESLKSKSAVLEAATIYMSEDNPREALKLLMLFDEQNPNDKQILFMIEMAAKQLRELGNKGETDKTFEKEIEEEIEKEAEGDQNRKDLQEEQIIHLNVVGAKQSEQRHEKQDEAATRAEDESLERMPSNSIEEALTEDFYDKEDDGYILNEDATGEEVQQVEFDNIQWTDEERNAAKLKLYQRQDRITHREGLLSQFTDKTGEIIGADEAEERQEKDLDGIAETLSDEAYDRIQKKQAAEAPVGSIIEMQRQVAARRKAREYVDKRVNERIKHAA